jgi:hypothetical protein
MRIEIPHLHEWQQGVIDGHMDQPGTSAVGARCHTTRRIGGANRPSTSDVRYISPPATWSPPRSSARRSPTWSATRARTRALVDMAETGGTFRP